MRFAPIGRALSVAAVSVGVVFAALQDGARDSALDEQQRSALAADAVAYVERHVAVLEARDEDLVRAQFVDDERFAWFTDGALQYASADAVLAGMRSYEGVRFETELSGVRAIVLSAEHTSVRSRFETRLTIPGTDDVRYGGVITWLLERDTDESTWRVLLGHTSTPAGPPGRGADGDGGRDAGREANGGGTSDER